MTTKSLLILAAKEDMEIKQWDVKSAFPNAPLDEEIYVEQPLGFIDPKFPNKVCKLNKALYGLKQAARQWYQHLLSIVYEIGFIHIPSDQSVFYNSITKIIITSHIDDLLIFGSDIMAINELKFGLSQHVEISDLGDVSFYLDMTIIRNR